MLLKCMKVLRFIILNILVNILFFYNKVPEIYSSAFFFDRDFYKTNPIKK